MFNLELVQLNLMSGPPMDPTPPAPDPEPQPPTDAPAAEMPILVRPVPRSDWPRAISTVRTLTGWQVALVMILGNCSFGMPLLEAIMWTATQLNWDDALGYAILLAWAVGLAAIATYAHLTIRWAGRADRRARIVIIIGTATLVCLTALAVPPTEWDSHSIGFVLLVAAPSLHIQAVVLRCVYGREGRRWFAKPRDESEDPLRRGLE